MQSVSCRYPGCTKHVYPKSLYCSMSHRDTAPCEYPGCTEPCYRGSTFCSLSHRDNAPQSQVAKPKAASPTTASRPVKGMSDDTSPWPISNEQQSPSENRSSSSRLAQAKKAASAAQHRLTATTNVFAAAAPGKQGDLALDVAPSPEPVIASKVSHPEGKPTKPPANEIWFYNKGNPYYDFTNFAPYEVTYNGKTYPTSEHLFQALKFTDNKDMDLVRTQNTPREAFQVAQLLRDKTREGWVEENLSMKCMHTAVLLKFTQHECLKELLLDTGDAKLVEDSPIDAFWGIGSDHKGENKLGEILMKVRAQLREIS